MKKSTTAIIILTILLIGSLSYIAYNIIYNQAYQQGINDGQLSVIQKVQEGSIPVISNQGNQTQLNWVDIRTICGSGG